jgi:hypothetical protein
MDEACVVCAMCMETQTHSENSECKVFDLMDIYRIGIEEALYE